MCHKLSPASQSIFPTIARVSITSLGCHCFKCTRTASPIVIEANTREDMGESMLFPQHDRTSRKWCLNLPVAFVQRSLILLSSAV